MPPKKKATGYQFAPPLAAGEILEDSGKQTWRLGQSIGKGGFGEIYAVQDASSRGKAYPYVLKIEPHANGPLFVEKTFYMNNCKSEDVEAFKKSKGLKTFGMPVYIASGTHEYNNEKYRFLVMEKFGQDLGKIFDENDRQFPKDTVFKLALQILDILEYIHNRGYVHADVKGENILLGISKDTKNKQVYLVDFGLACKLSNDDVLKPNPKKAHDGTIEYLSRDAHLGVQTRRGDLEILAYNIIRWLGGKLPWETSLKNPKTVQSRKEENMKDIPAMLQACFGSKIPTKVIEKYLKYINSLEFNEVPHYKKIRDMFLSAIKEAGGSVDSPLGFTAKNGNVDHSEVNGDVDYSPKKRQNASVEKSQAKKAKSTEIVPDVTNATVRNTRGAAKRANSIVSSPNNPSLDDSMEGYTDAMREIALKKKENAKTTKRKKAAKR